jgi:hypothetical protein
MPLESVLLDTDWQLVGKESRGLLSSGAIGDVRVVRRSPPFGQFACDRERVILIAWKNLKEDGDLLLMDIGMRISTLATLSLMITGCALHGHRIDFTRLRGADRIEVMDKNGKPFSKIQDQRAIDEAVRFIQRYGSGWKDPFGGPVVPDFLLMFYQGERFVGGFGIGYRDIVSYPPADGFWSQEVPDSELTRLSQTLGLSRPSVAEPKKD